MRLLSPVLLALALVVLLVMVGSYRSGATSALGREALEGGPIPPTTATNERLPFYGTQFVPIDELPQVRALGFDTVLTDFAYDAQPADWLAYLDAAQREDVRVIPWLWPEGWTLDRRSGAWTIDAQAQLFLRTVAGHPALFAVYGLHEPYWNECAGCGYSTAQQQALYRAIKAIAPVPVYSEINGFAFWAERGAATTIAAGVCDYCQTAFYPFERGGIYNRDELIAHMELEIAALQRHAPDVKLIWTMQSMSHRGDNLRMPTADEMIDYAQLAYGRPEIAGAWWYVWRWDGDLYPDYLAKHPALHPAVWTIADTIVAPRRGPAPITMPTPSPTPEGGVALFLPLVGGVVRGPLRR